MATPSTPSGLIVQQGDSQVYLSWNLTVGSTSYQVQRSTDNVNFSVIASPTIYNYLDSNVVNSFATQISISSASVLTVGDQYVITSMGTSVQADWEAVGLDSSITAEVGAVFIATITGGGIGTGTVQVGLLTGVQYFYKVAATGTGTSPYTASQGIIPCDAGKECLGNLRLYAQQRADKVNSNFITTSEWNKYITESYKELYDIIIQKYGDDYYSAIPFTFTTSGSKQLYTLPNGKIISLAIPTPEGNSTSPVEPSPALYKLLGVEVALNFNDPNSWVSLRKFEFIQRNLWNYPNVYTFRGVTNLRYRINGDNLYLVPQTQAGQYIRIWYAPRPNVLIRDIDMIDGVSGWEEYIAVDAAIKAMAKEESDVSVLMAQKMALLQRIESAAENRDVGEPETVSDSKMRNLAWTDDSGYGSGSGGL